ncbi:MAG: hypothetical protein KGJ23_11240 [Euryarchaeota archaeon]|nr:hypothetical protein [Euryarchaeota archaeon]MDE1837168.1 hypothetical protein [Euryarchaeota archaeon]MDE1881494.1 hypothetical protein [Euryarchaeota archaeon]MDE2045324.1 hypothetical protein [Thermoplasmata archaeon]
MQASPRETSRRAPPDAEHAHPRARGRWPRLDLWTVALAALLAMSSLLVAPAQAEPVPVVGETPHSVVHATAGANCQNATCDLAATLSNIQYFLIGVAILLAGIAFAIYGIQHMLGSLEDMDPNKKATRNRQFYSIVVGLVIVLMSVVLVSVAQGLIVG